MRIDVKSLTSCSVATDGTAAAIEVKDARGERVALNLDVDQMGALVMTLPGLIDTALQRRHQDATLRFSYPVAAWTVEHAADPEALLLTLKTTDGFGISFSIPKAAAGQLGGDVALQTAEAKRTRH